MGASHALLHWAQSGRILRIARGLALVFIAVFGGAVLLSTAHAQTAQVSLVTLVTDQTPLNLSTHFGVPNLAIVNQNGDYAFVGEGYGDISGHGEGSALFLRRAGASAATRLLQFGDPVPGMAGDTAVEFNVGGLNSSGHLLFRVDYTVSPPDGRLHRAFLIYDGVSTYRTVVSSDTVAPGSGQTFGPDLSCTGGTCLDNNDDVFFSTDFEPFAGTDTVPNLTTYYIAPAGGTPVRVVGLGDAMPGEPGATFTAFGNSSQMNALGQFLFSGQFFNGTTTINGLFLASTSGVIKVVAAGDAKSGGGTFSPALNLATDSGELNDGGQVAFVDPVSGNSPVATVWLYTSGSLFETDNNSAGSTISLSGLSNLGSAVGSTSTSVVRIHSNGVVDTVAATAQAAPGVSGATFTAFFDLDIDNNDRAIFTASLSSGGTGIYQQTGTATPVVVALGGQSSGLSGGGTLNLATDFVLPTALDNGSTFFSATISGGAANFAEYLGTPTSLQALLSSQDTLPAGARVRLSLPESNSGNGNNNSLFVGFAASLAGGQTALFVKDVIQGTTTRVVSEGDAIPGFGGATFVLRSLPFYMNGSGQVLVSAFLSNGGQAILLAGPTANLVTKAAATGDSVAGSTILGVGLSNNTTALSPINDSGQVAFYANLSNGLEGIFLFDGGTTLFKIAVSGDTVPEGGGTFSFFRSSPAASLGVNSNGQVAFGASKLPSAGGTATGLYVGSASGSPTKVVASGDTRPGSASTFGVLDPVSGFNDNGQIVFEAQNGGGVFTGPGTGGTPAVTAIALDGAASPGTGGGTLATSTPAFSTGTFPADNAAIDDNGDVVFQSRVTGGTSNSGYFRVLNNGGTLGPLQVTVLQGQTVTGAGTLGTMFPSFLNNPFFSLESNGNGNGGTDFIFTNSFTNTNGTMVGQFFSAGGLGVIKMMVPGDVIPGTGGGVYSTSTIRSQINDDTPTFEVLTAGGTTTQAIVFAVTEGGTVNTTTTLVSLLNPSGIGASTEFTATVTSSQGAPPIGDIVAFFDNGVAIGIGFTDTNGNATITTGSLSAGSHSITAEYFPNNSNNTFLTSTSNVVTQVVSNATSTLLFSTQNPSAPAQSVLFEAIVSPVAGGTSLPTGTVTFLDGATQIGTGTLASDVATFTTSSLAAGSHTITAQYSGDSVFAASISAPVTQIVQTAGGGLLPSATALSSSVDPSFAGQSVTFTAPVNGPSGGTPTGTVAFLDAAVQIGTGTIISGQATFTTSSLGVGSHPITAVYAGNTSFTGSTSNLVTQVVTGTVLTASVAPKFAFAANLGFPGNVSAYTVDAGTGALTPVPGSPFATGGQFANATGGTPVTVDPGGRFVYTLNNDSNTLASVSIFSVDATTGALTLVPGSPFATGTAGPGSVTADPSGRFVYVASECIGINLCNSGAVSVFSVDATTGALSPVPGSPFASGGIFPNSVSADPSGRFVYVANESSDTISVFSVNGTTGALTPVPGSPFASGGSIVSVSADPGGRFVYEIDANGGTISVFSVNATTGALTPVPGSPFASGGLESNSLSTDPGGRFVYAANVGSVTISVFSVNATTGALTPVAGSPFASGGGPNSISADPSGRFVYVSYYNVNGVGVFSVDGTTGALTPVAGSAFASGGITAPNVVAAFGSVSSPSATLVSLAVQPGTASISTLTGGNTQQFTAVGTYSDASKRFLTASATWSSATGAANISNTAGSSGVATGVAQGSTSITASLNGVISPAAILTVNSGAPAITSPASTTFTEGTPGTFTVTATGTPSPALSESGTLPSNVTFTDNGNGTATLAGTPAFGTSGGYPITITAQNGIGTNATQNFTLAVSSIPTTMTLTSSLNPSIVGQGVTFTATVTATGVTPAGNVAFLDGTAAIGAGTLSNGVATFGTSSLTVGSHSIRAQFADGGDFSPSASNVVTQVVQTTGGGGGSEAATCATAPSGQESVLNGRWVARMQGWHGTGPGFPFGAVFSFDANGSGSFLDVSGGSGITGNLDLNDGALGASSVFSGNVLTAGSSYKVGLDPTTGTGGYVGCMTLATSGASMVARFALSVNNGSAVSGRVIDWTDASGTGAGIRTSGLMLPQDATAFSGGTFASLHSNYAFGEDGADPNGGRLSIVGTVGLNTATGQFSGTSDSNDAGSLGASQTLSGTFTGLSSTTGRTLNTAATTGSSTPAHSATYIVNANELFVIGIDPYTSSNSGVYVGRAIVTGTTFTNSSLNGNYVLQGTGSATGNSSCNGGGNCAQVSLGVLNLSNGTVNSPSAIYNYTPGSAPQISNQSGTYSVASSGRASFTIGNHPPVMYLATPQPNAEPVTAFVAGTDSAAVFGEIQAGANSNVSASALAGNYVNGDTDTGDSTVGDEASVVLVNNVGTLTGFHYKSDLSGLSEGSINSGSTPGVLTFTNSPLPGFGNLGDSTTIAVSNGIRIWFIDTGGSDTSAARIGIVEPAGLTTISAAPVIQSLSTSSGPVGTPITITGTNFGTTQGTSTVTVNGVSVGTASSWSSTSIAVTVPSGASGTGQVVVTVLGLASNGVTFTVTASLQPSATALSSSLNPSITGQSVTFTASVVGSGGGTPTGTVTFLDGTTSIDVFPISGGVAATFITSSLSIGSHSITAVYAGDANFSGSTSNVVVQVVQAASLTPTSTTLISSLDPSVSTQSVQFTAIVTSGGGTPAGNVTFFDGTASLGAGALNASGVATFTTSLLSTGAHSITAQFTGGATFAASTSSVVTQTVTINPTSTTLVSSLNPSSSTQFVQFTAIVASSTGATPAGNVTFFDGVNQIGAGTLAGGQATFGIASLSVGSHPITVQYAGTANFGPSTSNGVTQTVNPSSNPITNPTTAPTFILISASPDPSLVVGQPILITATVSSSTAGTPTGSVSFLDNGTSIGTSQLNGSGAATLTTSSLAAGSHPITAQYFGDANFAASFSTLVTETVGTTATPQVSVQITPIPENVSSNNTIPFTATVLNAGGNGGVTWTLTGPGSVSSSGVYTAPTTSSMAATITLVATSLADETKQATIQFTLAADALTTAQVPQTLPSGSTFTAAITLTGAPATGPNSSVPFLLSCSPNSLPPGASCVFTTTPPTNPPTVTGANPQFTVSIVTSGNSTANVAPWRIEPLGPWYALFAVFLAVVAMMGSRGRVIFGRMGYACLVLALMCISVVFLTSCNASPQSVSVPVPTVATVTPSGNYQALVIATPTTTTGNNFVQTQLIVPFVVK